MRKSVDFGEDLAADDYDQDLAADTAVRVAPGLCLQSWDWNRWRHDYDDDSGDYEIIYIGYDDDDNDEELPDGGDPPCPHSNGSFIAHDSDLKLFGALLRYRL